ncbi:MAG: aminodeoxychorismate/anthranilate synthase component II [Nitrosopumilus sp.]|nr:aminodeoxychorismate/anthranilate synthase component II [Nitrosopumilus sp.]CAI9831332.1 Anthranilate/para-aminobenzoate synthases component II [Nitrosopumilaceae archaeon]MDA7940928.1 aminodeoxychorismate/anthranilate synthase component II [Nitrosopumilus sp.]MDA7943216.1 aminodeoxychorismate/anthranilate synthase component II [Nitrosopumilus sp.]MDA7944291.1 aminodeoxychorismate/anthranilate synthase component II [Nitrosopumilus sp.]
MRFVIVDNYDSFVYNIAHRLGEAGVESDVVRNDAIGPEGIMSGGYDAVVISPGPGTPEDPRYFGACGPIIREVGPRLPVLGVCLGHQGIVDAYGGRVANAGLVRHGKTSPVSHDGTGLFAGVPSPFRATRYHSLVGERTSIPADLEVTAVADDDGEVMAVRHRRHPVFGVQFHPESIMTEDGGRILANFAGEVRRA